MNPFKAFVATFFSRSNPKIDLKNLPSIYDIKINSLQGQPINLSAFKGKHILFVNVASKCGFTPQYKDLQILHDTYKDKLQIIGVPCNQFGNQEPGDANAIEEFCEVNYGVSFLITEKIDVKGHNQHPLYSWLTQQQKNGKSNSSVKWNFQKYIVSPEGQLLDYLYSTSNPNSSKITKYLK
ncbi:glutathione peroxidase [Olleya sp. UBA1516]|uniref:glutathione peroxidase n=1 Tax=Olleya sp. UBA1516 TaxID=1947013 RepID=UPI0025F1C80A|nr:glutathione peroxidase [Olleya sp. UBA1516]|tara:strand:- start:11457 stop:11999 length:543 start_codon:yes stop_codon:yes gene_type:complete